MATARQVQTGIGLQRAAADKARLLGDLLELYVEELSEIFPVERGPARVPHHGLFGRRRIRASAVWLAVDR